MSPPPSSTEARSARAPLSVFATRRRSARSLPRVVDSLAASKESSNAGDAAGSRPDSGGGAWSGTLSSSGSFIFSSIEMGRRDDVGARSASSASSSARETSAAATSIVGSLATCPGEVVPFDPPGEVVPFDLQLGVRGGRRAHQARAALEALLGDQRPPPLRRAPRGRRPPAAALRTDRDRPRARSLPSAAGRSAAPPTTRAGAAATAFR